MKTAKKKADDRQKQTQIRMNDALKTRIRKYQQQVQRETGIVVSFGAAVRALIERGLEVQ